MFKEQIEQFYPEMAAIREDIHRHPELSRKEFRTCSIVMEKLKEYGVDTVENVWNTGVVATVKGTAGDGKCIALRADMDALPMQEDTGLPFSSENPGVMHSCGHDLHVAILLTVARTLSANRNKFKGTVKFIFQPSEESANPKDPTGGAYHMVNHGAMEGVDAIAALHVRPSKENVGAFEFKKGVMTSGFDLYNFDVFGKSAHGSQPQLGNDAILAVSQLIVMLQQIVSRNIDPMKSVVLTVGTLSGGTAVNIIPGEAHCGGVFRYYDNDAADVIKEHTLDIARGVEAISGCKIKVDAIRGYACVNNDSKLTELANRAIQQELKDNSVFKMETPSTVSEDFGYYGVSTGKPSFFAWFNTDVVGDEVYPLHSSKLALRSEGIINAAAGMCSIAVNYLNDN